MKIALFGSSLVSAYWNGAATYYRGIVRALHERGHRVTFYEPDALSRQQHRDMDDPEWADVVVYEARPEVALDLVRRVRADVIVKASGVGVFDELLESAVLERQSARTAVVFWDVDAPATLQRMEEDPSDAFRPLVARYDRILTYGGGEAVVRAYEALGARACVPIYNAVDETTHRPVPPESAFDAEMSFLGNRLPDREARVDTFFFDAARALPNRRFLLGGSGWESLDLPPNVRHLGHVYTRDHNAFNATPKAVLNVSRESMAAIGFSPATRVFEAAAAGGCLVSDAWEGLDAFLEPGREVLVARDGQEVAAHLRELTVERARRIGERARERVLRDHTYAHRARRVEEVLGEVIAERRGAPPASAGDGVAAETPA